MKPELRKLLTGRGIELPGENEIAQLRELEGRWRTLQVRRALVAPWRVAEDQQAAREAFLADPSPENEMQVAVLADTSQTALRYAARHRVLWEAMGLLDAAKAAVAEAEKAMLATTSPAMQNYLYRELREKQRELQATLSKTW